MSIAAKELTSKLWGLSALWKACCTAARSQGACATLNLQKVTSIQALDESQGPFDAIVVAAGAAAGVLPEVGPPLCDDINNKLITVIPHALHRAG